MFSPLHAVTFATVSGVTGISMLALGVNGMCASLGALTLVLYTLVYTPMKRTTIANTWAGAVGKNSSRTFMQSRYANNSFVFLS